MGVGACFCMYDVVVKKFTFAISSPDEFLFCDCQQLSIGLRYSAECGLWKVVKAVKRSFAENSWRIFSAE